jgi:hypothetical protein
VRESQLAQLQWVWQSESDRGFYMGCADIIINATAQATAAFDSPEAGLALTGQSPYGDSGKPTLTCNMYTNRLSCEADLSGVDNYCIWDEKSCTSAAMGDNSLTIIVVICGCFVCLSFCWSRVQGVRDKNYETRTREKKVQSMDDLPTTVVPHQTHVMRDLHRLTVQGVNWVEQKIGMDLDRDGDVGAINNAEDAEDTHVLGELANVIEKGTGFDVDGDGEVFGDEATVAKQQQNITDGSVPENIVNVRKASANAGAEAGVGAGDARLAAEAAAARRRTRLASARALPPAATPGPAANAPTAAAVSATEPQAGAPPLPERKRSGATPNP